MRGPDTLHVIGDVDDTKIKHIAGWLTWLNARIGTNFAEDQYQEDIGAMTGLPEDMISVLAVEFHASGVVAEFEPVDGAPEAVGEIAEHALYSSLTSRRRLSEGATRYSL